MHVTHTRTVQNILCFPKKQNVTGLQLADLIAYPITQHLLFPDRVNFAYDIIKDNLYESKGKKLGLKVIPNPDKGL